MTQQAEIILRERISAGLAGYSEIATALSIEARALSDAMAQNDLQKMEQHARFIADISAFLQKGYLEAQI